jgi:hypothetical protein
VRLFRRTWGSIDGRDQQVGNNGDVVTVPAQDANHLTVRTKEGQVAEVEWRRLADLESKRMLLGLGHALTIDAAQGLTSDEHINALPRGTAGVSAFTSYVAESRAKGTTWTVIFEGALMEAERHRQALGDVTPITTQDLWDRAAADMSEKPYKGLGIDLLASAQPDRDQAVGTFIARSYRIENARTQDMDAGPKAFERLRAAAVNESLERHLTGLDHAIAANALLLGETERARETAIHLRELRETAAKAARRIDLARPIEDIRPRTSSLSP